MGKGKKTCKTQRAKTTNGKSVQHTSSEVFLMPDAHFYGRVRILFWSGAHFYGRARTFMATRACLSPGHAFVLPGPRIFSGNIFFNGRARIFMAGRALLLPGRAFLQPGSTTQRTRLLDPSLAAQPQRLEERKQHHWTQRVGIAPGPSTQGRGYVLAWFFCSN